MFLLYCPAGHTIQEATEDGESLLSLACSAGYYELAEVLLRMRASVEDRGVKGMCMCARAYVCLFNLLLFFFVVVVDNLSSFGKIIAQNFETVTLLRTHT